MGHAVITVVGNLAKDPVVKDVKATRVAEFSVPVNVGKDETIWYNCAVWGKAADFVEQYFKKGSGIVVTGRLGMRTYDSKGTTKVELKVTADGFPAFAGSKAKSEPQASKDEEELPF